VPIAGIAPPLMRSRALPPLEDDIQKAPVCGALERADDGARTHDPQLGKLMLYQLSYVRAAPIVPPLLPPSAVGDQNGRTDLDVVEEPLRVRDVHADASV
jgi:hypothetical protein